jgi:NADH-quinone oxidoreductase subunit M
MILLLLVLLPFCAGILAWLFGRRDTGTARWISASAMTIQLVLAVSVWIQNYNRLTFSEEENWLIEFKTAWIPRLGIKFFLAIDGLSLLMIVLTAFLGLIAVIASWSEIRERVAFYHFNLLWILAGINGVFMAMDLFLFYFFWEMMLLPMYFLIGIWGHEKRIKAAVKFFIFTQAAGLLMLLAIVGLWYIHYNQTGVFTFDYFELLHTELSGARAMFLMLGFFIGFAVKLPAFPFHPWLPDAHTEAPTAGSIILAGLLLKTGAYGLLRFVLPIFPQAAADFAPYAMYLGVISIIYGALMAYAQDDLKRLVAYTSVSHLGFVLVGIFALNDLAFQGAVMQMICHGISTGALFLLVGIIQEHIHTRDMNRMGGLWTNLPRMGGIAMFFAMASLGLPGLGNFVAEFLVLAGTFQTNHLVSILAAIGLIVSAVYALWLIQKTFFGEKQKDWHLPDLSMRNLIMFGVMIVVLVWLGIFPDPVLNTAQPVSIELENKFSKTRGKDIQPLDGSVILSGDKIYMIKE